MKINSSKAFFIKLGPKGRWERDCIEKDNTIQLGFNNPLHSECLAGNWDKVEDY